MELNDWFVERGVEVLCDRSCCDDETVERDEDGYLYCSHGPRFECKMCTPKDVETRCCSPTLHVRNLPETCDTSREREIRMSDGD